MTLEGELRFILFHGTVSIFEALCRKMVLSVRTPLKVVEFHLALGHRG